VKKSDFASLQQLEKSLMDLLHEHLTIIHHKVDELAKAKAALLKLEKSNREF
jgi:hypothetical protein